VQIDGDSHGEPKQHLEEEEAIEVILVPMKGLFQYLQKASTEGIIVDAKVYTFALASTMSINITK